MKTIVEVSSISDAHGSASLTALITFPFACLSLRPRNRAFICFLWRFLALKLIGPRAPPNRAVPSLPLRNQGHALADEPGRSGWPSQFFLFFLFFLSSRSSAKSSATFILCS